MSHPNEAAADAAPGAAPASEAPSATPDTAVTPRHVGAGRARLPRVVGRFFGTTARGARKILTPLPEAIVEPVPPTPHAVEERRYSAFGMGFMGAIGVLVALALAQAVLTVQSVLILAVLALFLALGLNPAVEFLTRLRVPRGIGVALVTLMLLGVLALGVVALVPIFTEQTTALTTQLPEMLQTLLNHPLLAEWEQRDEVLARAQEFITSGALLQNLFGGLMGAGRLVANLVFSVIVTLVLTVYFLASLPTIKETIYALAPASRRPRARYLADGIFGGVSGYITGMFVIVSIASVSALIFMNIAGLGDYSLALAFVVAIFCFIPLVGSSLAMITVAIVGFAVDPAIGIATIIYFVIYQQFDAYILYPNVMKRTVKVPGALVVLSAIIGGMLFGVIGAVIAIPTTAAVLLLYREIIQPALDAS
ncbi:AI-2E family transporter [Tessaracoccus sp. Y36]